jgi:hypothetical protein
MQLLEKRRKRYLSWFDRYDPSVFVRHCLRVIALELGVQLLPVQGNVDNYD